ncbi:MAG: ribonuclease R [Candidatus Electryonea clarkiae]|nr:ribonuclease R [Candidatus Electryonea clarkiae]MDP8285230.1 ribonuclease R [Candidatus Electryonea clarkiae]
MKKRRKSTHPHQKSGKQSKRIPSNLTRAAETAVIGLYQEEKQVRLRVQDIIEQTRWAKLRDTEMRRAIESLISKGILRYVKGKRLEYVENNNWIVQGKISLAADGYGFLDVKDWSEDVFLGPRSLLGARHGDIAEVEIIEHGQFGRKRGRVRKILERNETPVTGRFFANFNHGGIVYPDDPRFPGKVLISESKIKNAIDGDRVQVQLSDAGAIRGDFRGRIVQVFGSVEDPDACYRSLIARYGFHEKFPQGVVKETAELPDDIPSAEIAEREDLRQNTVITIDPESARDFDDAISLKKLPDGNYELGVHIADVSWYVKPGGKIDIEARQRGTSVYTSHGTLPMIPERLSSELCSLKEGVDRLTFSVFMILKPSGEVVKSRIARCVIKSSKRFTYEEVQNQLDRDKLKYKGDIPAWNKDDLDILLLHLNKLTQKMRKTRFENGGLNLEVPEYEVELDENKKPVALRKHVIFESNQLVEECMLAANKAVTEYAVRKRGEGIKAFVYRVHARPDKDRLKDFAAFVQSLDIEWRFGSQNENLTSKRLNEWLSDMADHPLRDILRIHTLRAMSKAEYNTENIGHYGLEFANYTHFTSPIRRYPDLMVHRLILDSIEGRELHGKDVQADLEQTCSLANEREKAASEMERTSMKIRQSEYFAAHIGHEFDGLIVNIIPKGIFVEIIDTGANGMIRGEDLGTVSFDYQAMMFIDVVSGESWQPGKRLRVKVTKADVVTGLIDLEPV